MTHRFCVFASTVGFVLAVTSQNWALAGFGALIVVWLVVDDKVLDEWNETTSRD